LGSTSRVQRFVAQARKLLPLPEEAISFGSEGTSITVRITGELPGERPIFAWRRRRGWMGGIRRLARRIGVEVSFDFSSVNDAIGALERAVSHSLRSVLGAIEFVVSIEYNKASNVRAIVMLGEYRTSSEQRRTIEAAVRDALISNGQRRIDRVVVLDGGLDEATDPQVLRMLRIYGPVSKEEVRNQLERQQLKVPSAAWLDRTMDRLRRRKLVRYLENGLFAISAEAFLQMPSRAGRTSVDIQRALVLARRRAW